MNGFKSIRLLALGFMLFFIGMLAETTFADGFIVIPIPGPPATDISLSGITPLEIKFHHVKVQIKDQTALTIVEQEFYNPTHRRLEGTYIFPVPKNAVMNRFSMDINGREQTAEFLEAAKARQIYEDIVRKQLDPALLEYSGQAAFKVRIFPIEPYSTKKVKISYQEILNKDNGTYEYVYPLNTEKLSAKNLADVTLTINIQANAPLKNIFCTSHEVDILRKGEQQAVIRYEAQNVKPETDFKLYYNTVNSKIGLSLTTYKQNGEDGFFLLNINPGFTGNDEEIIAKDLIFVLDNSGSMAGEKMEQAQKALLFCINNLNQNDRFEIIRFSTEAEALFNRLVAVEPPNLEKARTFIKNLSAIGGTNIEEALDLALSSQNSSTRPRMVIFVTDGKPTVGETREDSLIEKLKSLNRSGTRIFTFGIGYEVNTHLLDEITELTRAYRTYISPQEDLELAISNFYQKIQTPVLTNLKLSINDNIRLSKTYPQDLPDLFKGGSLTVLGQYQGHGPAKIILTGNLTGKQQKFEYVVTFPIEDIKNAFIPPLWAARRIGYLLDQIRLHGEEWELVNETTILARKYGVITPYTSYLIMEDEKNRVSQKELEESYQTLANILPVTSDLIQKNKQEYYRAAEKSGVQSTQASQEFQMLSSAESPNQIYQGESRLIYKDKKGGIQNLVQQVKLVQGRAFYNTAEYWIDSQLQENQSWPKVRLKFAGKEYFELLKTAPNVAEFLALGKNIRFVFNNKRYEIYE